MMRCVEIARGKLKTGALLELYRENAHQRKDRKPLWTVGFENQCRRGAASGVAMLVDVWRSTLERDWL